MIDISTGEVRELAASANGHVTGLAWSPDSAWLAWSEPAEHPVGMSGMSLRRLRLARLADGQVTDVTDGRFTDTDPVTSLMTASIWLSCPGAASTLSTTRTSSTCRFPMVLGRTCCSCRLPRHRRSALSSAAGGSAVTGRQAVRGSPVVRGSQAVRDSLPVRESPAVTKPAPQRPRSRSTSTAWPTGSSRCPCQKRGTPACAR